MEDIGQIAIECDLDKPTVTQILYTLKKRGDIQDTDGILESEQFDEHDEDHSGCGCHICNCVGECECECCCSCSEKEECQECGDPLCNGLCKYTDHSGPMHTKYTN
jgi:hypothetical protein